MKKFSGTWLLAILTIALVLYSYFFEFKKKKEDESTKEKQATILHFDKDKIAKIKISNGSKTTVLERVAKDAQAPTWAISEPVSDQADANSVNSFLDSALAEKSTSEINDDGLNYSMFGLENPVGKISFITHDGKETNISVGTEAIGGKQYVRVDDAKSVLVGTPVWKTLVTKPILDLRDKDLYRNSGKTIKSINLFSLKKNQKLTFNRTDKGWAIQDAKVDVDSEAVQNFVTQIDHLKALDVAAEDKKNIAAYGLQNPMVKVNIEFSDSSLWSADIGKKKEKDNDAFAVIQNLKPIYKVNVGLIENLSKSVAEFRDRKKPFKFATSDIKEIQIESDLLKADLVKKDDSWSVKNGPVGKTLDQTEVKNLLERLADIKAKEFLNGNKPFQPKRTITLKGPEDKTILELKFSDPAHGKNETMVASTQTKDSMTVDSDLVNRLPAQTLFVDALKDKKDKKTSP